MFAESMLPLTATSSSSARSSAVSRTCTKTSAAAGSKPRSWAPASTAAAVTRSRSRATSSRSAKAIGRNYHYATLRSSGSLDIKKLVNGSIQTLVRVPFTVQTNVSYRCGWKRSERACACTSTAPCERKRRMRRPRLPVPASASRRTKQPWTRTTSS